MWSCRGRCGSGGQSTKSAAVAAAVTVFSAVAINAGSGGSSADGVEEASPPAATRMEDRGAELVEDASTAADSIADGKTGATAGSSLGRGDGLR